MWPRIASYFFLDLAKMGNPKIFPTFDATAIGVPTRPRLAYPRGAATASAQTAGDTAAIAGLTADHAVAAMAHRAQTAETWPSHTDGDDAPDVVRRAADCHGQRGHGIHSRGCYGEGLRVVSRPGCGGGRMGGRGHGRRERIRLHNLPLL